MPSEHTFQSALGWFDLGNYVEAFNELENLPPEHRASIEVMELRCRIYRKLEKWKELETVSQKSQNQSPPPRQTEPPLKTTGLPPRAMRILAEA